MISGHEYDDYYALYYYQNTMQDTLQTKASIDFEDGQPLTTFRTTSQAQNPQSQSYENEALHNYNSIIPDEDFNFQHYESTPANAQQVDN